MNAVIESTGIDIAGVKLDKGSHSSYDRGVCVMELLALVKGLPEITDSMPCVAPDIRHFLISLNDSAPEGPRQRLLELIDIPSLSCCVIGTAGKGDAQKRAYLLADWAVRVIAPLACEAAGKPDHAATIRALAEVVDPTSATAAGETCRSVRDALPSATCAATCAAATAAYTAHTAHTAATAASATYAAAATAATAAYTADAATYATGRTLTAAEKLAARESMWFKIMDLAMPLIRKLCET
jgi:hypothetical protein